MSRKIVKLKDVVNITSGEFIHKQYQCATAEYPVYNGGVSHTGHYYKYNTTKDKVVISARGAGAGFVNKVETNFWCGNSCFVLNIKDSSVVYWRYLYYAMKNIQEELTSSKKEGAIPSISKKQLEGIAIPLPPLTEQQAVVDKLDLLTEYAMEMSKGIPKEIELRQKQYEYYRDEWLSFNKEVAFLSLDKVAKIRNGKDYKNFNSGAIPVYGSGGIMSYIDNFAYDKPSVLIPRKGSLSKLYYLEKPFWTVDTLFYTEINADLIIPKYLFYYLQTLHLEELNQSGGVPSLTQSQLNILKIPLPSLTEQQGIVDKLDLLTDYITELNAILQAELKLRDKQYKYYLEQCINYSY